MEDYVRLRHIEEGFEYVGTPHIAKEGLFHTPRATALLRRGHVPRARRRRHGLPPQGDELPEAQPDLRRPQRSYRELPLRLFEFGSVYRHEKSGVVHGLTRVRGFPRTTPILLHPRAGAGEVKHLLDFMLSVLARDIRAPQTTSTSSSLSTRDDSKPDKFVGSDEDWAAATAVLEQVATESGLELVPDPGGAAFYGPKVSVQAKGRHRPHLADGHGSSTTSTSPRPTASTHHYVAPTARASSR